MSEPAAFFSYVHADDDHDGGLITQLHAALQGEARIQSGEEFPIFLDRDDIEWGDNWRKRIDGSLDSVALLIPVITPSFFRSTECRRELTRFLDRERELGRDDLVWPIYYVKAAEMEDPGEDPLAQALASRHYTDWRQLRFEPHTSKVVRERLAVLAERLSGSIQMAQPGRSSSGSVESEPERPAAPDEPPTISVDPYGRGDHTTIAEAVAAAAPGDRILVRPGLYEETVVIDKPLELIGQGAVEDIIVTAADQAVIYFQANIGRISNLTIRQAPFKDDMVWHAINIERGRLELEACHITSESGAGVYVSFGADPRVRGNRVYDSANAGIVVLGQALGTYEDNELCGNKLSGFETADDANPTVRRNRIHDNVQNGMLLAEGLGTFEGNDIVDNGFAGAEVRAGARPTMRGNRIHRNGYQGIWVYDGAGGTYEGNDLRDNKSGPWLIAEDAGDVTSSENLED